MEKQMKKITVLLFAFCFNFLGFSLFAENEMSSIQKNSYDMMNYLTISTMGIKKAENYYDLENIRKTLQNDINPRLIDEKTQEQITRLSKSLTEEKLQVLERERINYLYENAKSEAIRNAFPNPMYLLSGSLMGGGIPGALATVGMMTINSISNYKNAQNQAEIEYLKNSWKLVGQKVDTIDERLRKMFSYRVDISRQYKIPNEYYIFDERAVDIYTDILKYDSENKLGDCINQIADFQKNESIFKWYGPYWLDLAKAYFNRANFCSSESEKLDYYKKSLTSFIRYEEIRSSFFVRDSFYAKHIPMAIFVAQKTMDPSEYYQFALRELEFLKANWSLDDTELHYIASQIYISLFAQSNDLNCLSEAYKLIKENIPILTRKQETLMEQWVTPVPELDSTALPEEKEYYENIQKVHNSLKPPVCEALRLNAELIFGIIERISIDSKELDELKNSFNSVSYLFDFTDVNHCKLKALNEVDFPKQVVINDSFLPPKNKLIFAIIAIIILNFIMWWILHYRQCCGYAKRTIILTILGFIIPVIAYFFTKSTEATLLILLHFVITSLLFNHLSLCASYPGFIAVIFGGISLIIPVIIYVMNQKTLLLLILMGTSTIIFASLFVLINKILEANIESWRGANELEEYLKNPPKKTLNSIQDLIDNLQKK